ncbi:MAG TPA: hypothetical protein VF597_00010 [Candidatus Saccharimonadales bacterium]
MVQTKTKTSTAKKSPTKAKVAAVAEPAYEFRPYRVLYLVVAVSVISLVLLAALGLSAS